jgi:hypothetical protein
MSDRPKEERTCEFCGRSIFRYPSQFSGKQTFCSRACLGGHRSLHRAGPKAAHWKTGERVGLRVEWHLPWHHRANAKGYVPRAVIVAELVLGRPLAPAEIVHHKDLDSLNDDPGNLEVLPSQSEHARLHGRLRSPGQMAAMRAAKGATA